MNSVSLFSPTALVSDQQVWYNGTQEEKVEVHDKACQNFPKIRGLGYRWARRVKEILVIS